MTIQCPCGRDCSSCPYMELCSGCLEDGCIHVRIKTSTVNHSDAKCHFCKAKGISHSCPTVNTPPPMDFNCYSPRLLEDAIALAKRTRTKYAKQPDEPAWPLLIPELSDITETTSRLNVWPDEGDWEFRQWNPVGWDMTGYLFDKVHGAPWVFDSEELQEQDWQDMTGDERSWITDVLMVDRLPDWLAMQTPPTATMVAYLNRIWAFHWRFFAEDGPRLWILTHGYPSYLDWPPAWHWNLGMRMLSSLADYIGSQNYDLLGAAVETWYPDMSKKTDEHLHLPFTYVNGEPKLLWNPEKDYDNTREMVWPRFPGIIPFVPGADTTQLSWFTKQIISLGYTTVALDAVNSIGHENFKGLPEAINAVLKAGATHVMVYGPWPLHPPQKYVPTRNVSYIPSALHMDMTNHPARYWRKKESEEGEKKKWKRLPNYRRVSLSEVAFHDDLQICGCPACQAAREKEVDPRSVWRWGHMLHAGEKWMKRVAREKKPETENVPEKPMRLWYQGPSYAVFRRCLHYPPEVQWDSIDHVIDELEFSETTMTVVFPDGGRIPGHLIRWNWFDEGHHWELYWPYIVPPE